MISDPLTMPQVKAIEAVNDASTKEQLEKYVDGKGKIKKTILDEIRLPAIIACVEKWDIAGFPETVTVETFPLSPRNASHDFILWLFREINKVYSGEIEIPNE